MQPQESRNDLRTLGTHIFGDTAAFLIGVGMARNGSRVFTVQVFMTGCT